MSDLQFVNHGTVVMLSAATEAGQEWLDANLQIEPWQLLGGAIACEPRMCEAVAAGATGDGLTVALS